MVTWPWTKNQGVRGLKYNINAVRSRIQKLGASCESSNGARSYMFWSQPGIFVYKVQTIVCILRHDLSTQPQQSGEEGAHYRRPFSTDL